MLLRSGKEIIGSVSNRVSSKEIYLTTGMEWRDALTRKTYKGVQTIDYQITLEKIPFFSRNGFDF